MGGNFTIEQMIRNYQGIKKPGTPDPKRPVYYASSPESIYEAGKKIEDERAKALYYFLYVSGARINEARAFKPISLKVLPNDMEFNLPLLKTRSQFKKQIGRTVIVPTKAHAKCHENEMWQVVTEFTRQFEPTALPFAKWGNMSQYLRMKCPEMVVEAIYFNKSASPPMWVRDVIRKPQHPHFLRHCRATHLVEYYDFNLNQLMEFFRWANINMALRYIHMRDVRLAFLKQ